jgi:hypothetical protein
LLADLASTKRAATPPDIVALHRNSALGKIQAERSEKTGAADLSETAPKGTGRLRKSEMPPSGSRSDGADYGADARNFAE